MSGFVDQPKTHASRWNQSALEQGQELSSKIFGNQTYPTETKQKLSWRIYLGWSRVSKRSMDEGCANLLISSWRNQLVLEQETM